MKSRASISIEKIVIIILVLLVLVAAFHFLFGINPLKYLRMLPSYEFPEDDEVIDLSDMTDEQVESLCPKIVGKIDTNFIYIGDKKTNLYWDEKNKQIKLDVSGSDPVIGSIDSGGELILKDEYTKITSEYIKYIDSLPTLDEIRFINFAKKININYLCKTETQYEAFKKEIIKAKERTVEKGVSNKVNFFCSARFYSGSKGVLIYAKYNFLDKKPSITLLPNSQVVSGLSQELTSLLNLDEIRDELITRGMLKEDEIKLVGAVLSSKTQEIFVDKLNKLILSKRCYLIGNKDISNLSTPKLNNLLYGTDTAPGSV